MARPKEVQFTREELYTKVWEKPLIQLAKEFGISDRGLGKICQRYQIPLPGVGYWNKVNAGQKLTRKPLIPIKHTDKHLYNIINIYATNYDVFPDSLSEEVLNAIFFEKEEKNKIIFDAITNNNIIQPLTL